MGNGTMRKYTGCLVSHLEMVAWKVIDDPSKIPFLNGISYRAALGLEGSPTTGVLAADMPTLLIWVNEDSMSMGLGNVVSTMLYIPELQHFCLICWVRWRG